MLSIEARPKTIADGMSELKLIDSKLRTIINKVEKYGAWNDKRKLPLGDPKVSRDKNHEDAIKEVTSLFQSYQDLLSNYLEIKTAIDRTNLATVKDFAGKEMSLHEALLYQRTIIGDPRHLGYYKSLLCAYETSVSVATREVENQNMRQQMTVAKDADAEELLKLKADILYLLPKENIKTIEDFTTEFAVQINGLLNKYNAVTELIYEN